MIEGNFAFHNRLIVQISCKRLLAYLDSKMWGHYFWEDLFSFWGGGEEIIRRLRYMYMRTNLFA